MPEQWLAVQGTLTHTHTDVDTQMTKEVRRRGVGRGRSSKSGVRTTLTGQERYGSRTLSRPLSLPRVMCKLYTYLLTHTSSEA